MKRFLGAVAALTTALVLTGSPASAQVAIDVQRDGATTWVNGSVEQGDFSKVAIKVFTKEDGKLRLWQKCSYNYSGAGTYLCGLDSSAGSLAQEQNENWIAKISLDGEQLARQGFEI